MTMNPSKSTVRIITRTPFGDIDTVHEITLDFKADITNTTHHRQIRNVLNRKMISQIITSAVIAGNKVTILII